MGFLQSLMGNMGGGGIGGSGMGGFGSGLGIIQYPMGDQKAYFLPGSLLPNIAQGAILGNKMGNGKGSAMGALYGALSGYSPVLGRALSGTFDNWFDKRSN